MDSTQSAPPTVPDNGLGSPVTHGNGDTNRKNKWQALNSTKSRLFSVVGIFAVVGVYFLFSSFAATPIVATIQAESMTLPNGASVVSDSTASGSKAVAIPDNGSLKGSISIPASDTATSVTVVAHEANCTSGKADVAVTVDNTAAVKATAVNSTKWTNYSGNVSLKSGTHTVTITGSGLATAGANDNTGHGKKHNKGKHHRGFFNKHGNHNDSGNSGGSTTAAGGSNACALYVDVANVYGPTAASAPTVAFTASPTSVTSGGASTLTWTSANATSCTASGSWTGTKATSGSVSTGALKATSTFNLSCAGAGGTTATKATVTVTAATTGGGGTGTCPAGDTGTYPNCVPPTGGTGGGGTGGGGTGTGTSGSYTKPPTKQANGTPNQWYWEISPSNSGVAGLPATSAAYPAAGSANIWDTDLFQDAATTANATNSSGIPIVASPVVQAIHAVGHYSICYVEAGAFQTGFPDDKNFASADYGGQTTAHQMQGWSGEWWFDTSGFANYVAGQPSTLTGAAVNIASGMDQRIAGCKAEGQDALEPDDLDGFTNPSDSGTAGGGWKLTQADAAGYERWLAYDAHSHGLAIFQKNDTDNAKADASTYDGMIIEECNKYNDPCSADASPYTSLGKPVLNAEYTNDGESTGSFCSSDISLGITGALFDLNLDGKSYTPCQN